MNYIDYLIIGVILFYALWGLSKGLIKIIFDFIGYVVAFFTAKIFGPKLADILADGNLYNNIKTGIMSTFEKINPNLSSLETIEIPSNLNDMLQTQPGIQDIFNTYPKLMDTMQAKISQISGQGFIETLTDYVVLIIAVVIIFLVAKVVFSIIVSIILAQRDELPLAFVNRIFGMALGITIAAILLSFAFQLAEVYSLTSSPVLASAVAESKYGHYFTSLPLLEWISVFI